MSSLGQTSICTINDQGNIPTQIVTKGGGLGYYGTMMHHLQDIIPHNFLIFKDKLIMFILNFAAAACNKETQLIAAKVGH